MRTQLLMILAGCSVCLSAVELRAQFSQPPAPQAPAAPGYFIDQNTGITYRRDVRTIERPVVEEKVETREQSTWRPEVVTTVRDQQRTVYTPVVRYEWKPKWHGWWNPFSQPTLAYHLQPQTSWETRVETVQTPEVQTRWVENKQSVQVPVRVTRIERSQQIVDVPVSYPANRMQPMPGYQPNVTMPTSPRR